MDRLEITRTLSIPTAELSVAFSRSSGAGGQNVNKVSTRVEMRFDVAQSISLSEGQRAILLDRLASRLTATGVLVVNSDRHRTQGRNREDCQERLAAILAQALKPLLPNAERPIPGALHRGVGWMPKSARERKRAAVVGHSYKLCSRRNETCTETPVHAYTNYYVNVNVKVNAFLGILWLRVHTIR